MADWRDSVVPLTSTDPNNPGFGTGFVFHRDTTGRCFVLTCLHVVTTLERPGKDPAVKPEVCAAGEPAEVWVRGDGVLDLAVLAVDGLGLEPLRLGEPAERDTQIQTAGFAEFEREQKSSVRRPLTGWVRDNNEVWPRGQRASRRVWSLDIEIDAGAFRTLAEGYSGSPILNPATGTVVGVMNLKGSGNKGHALCVRGCNLLFERPESRKIPDYPPDRPEHGARPDISATQRAGEVVAKGTLDWMASTLDHTDPIGVVDRCLDEHRGDSGPRLWFYTFDAFLADCPETLAQHLAIKYGRRSLSTGGVAALVTELHPVRFDTQGLWKAMAAQISPLTAPGDEADDERKRILQWLNSGSGAGPRGLQVVYCQLAVAEKRSRIPDFIEGAIRDFSALGPDLHQGVRVLFLFGCVFEQTGLRGFLDRRLRRPSLDRIAGCGALGSLSELSPGDVNVWLRETAQAHLGGRRLNEDTRRRLDTLPDLFRSDAVRLRYKQIHRPALDILAQATLIAPP